MANKKTSFNPLLTTKSNETQQACLSAWKRVFSRSPIVVDFLKKHKKYVPQFNKDGSRAKKDGVRYTCAHCQKEFNSTKIQVDHINPVIPINIPARHVSWNTIQERLFCDESNLQILCKEHHKEKSKIENAERKEWLAKKKWIVYETVNKINNKKYVGVHSCIDYDDVYFGGGKLLKQAIKKYGIDNFYRVILFAYDNPEDAYKKEKELINDECLEADTHCGIDVGDSDLILSPHGQNKKIICHQTGQVFKSIKDAAQFMDVSVSSISKALNNPCQPVKNNHFFELDLYDPNVRVSFPNNGRSIVCLNNRTQYASIKDAAEALAINYDSLRDSLLEKTTDSVYKLESLYFLYADEYDPAATYSVKIRRVHCVEKNISFNTLQEAAEYIKHKNPQRGALAISKAIVNKNKFFKFTWKWLETDLKL